MTNKIEKIQQLPTFIDNTHESCFRSYHVLNLTLEMIERGDSKETIFDMVEFLSGRIIYNTVNKKPHK